MMDFNTENNKKTRGGKREGAGRKRKAVQYYGFRATQPAHDILQAIPEGKKANFINECIIKACKS